MLKMEKEKTMRMEEQRERSMKQNIMRTQVSNQVLPHMFHLKEEV